MASKSVVTAGFQTLMFRGTKYVAVLLAVLTLLGVIGAGVMLASTYGSKFESPVYGKSPEKSLEGLRAEVDTSAEAKLALTTSYGKDVIQLLGKSNLNKDIYFDQIINSMLGIPTALHGKYIDTAEDWMEASAKANVNADQAVIEFDRAFRQAVSAAYRQEESAKAERAIWISGGVAGATFFACLVILLVLIQIEANTRVGAISGNAGQPQPVDLANTQSQTGNAKAQTLVKSPLCPQCGEKVTDTDAFCEGCGAKLK